MTTQTAQVATVERAVTLQPVTMLIPNRHGVYAPSRIRQPITITMLELLTFYADNPRSILVSFEPDGISNPQNITAYGLSWDCWYIVSEVKNEAL